jgi:hypothetical protein
MIKLIRSLLGMPPVVGEHVCYHTDPGIEFEGTVTAITESVICGSGARVLAGIKLDSGGFALRFTTFTTPVDALYCAKRVRRITPVRNRYCKVTAYVTKNRQIQDYSKGIDLTGCTDEELLPYISNPHYTVFGEINN